MYMQQFQYCLRRLSHFSCDIDQSV